MQETWLPAPSPESIRLRLRLRSMPRAVLLVCGGPNLVGVIEDDDDTREAVVAALKDLGACVRGEPSCAAGLSAVADFMPQAILCDIAMPVEDGYCFIRKLRSLGADRGGLIPAAALTALAGDEDQKQALRAGFQLHLAKPIDSARMAKAVETLAGWTKPV